MGLRTQHRIIFTEYACAILLISMDSSRAHQHRRKLGNLKRLRDQFIEQEAILREAIPRTALWEGASDSVMAVLSELFQETAAALPEKSILFNSKDNGIDGLRGLIAS